MYNEYRQVLHSADVLMVIKYQDSGFRIKVLEELGKTFPCIKKSRCHLLFKKMIREMKASFSCVVNLNLVLINNNVYVPVFGSENEVLSLITSKKTLPKKSSLLTNQMSAARAAA